MPRTLQKQVALLFIAVLFILALVPAYYPAEEEMGLRSDSPFSNAYDLLFTATNTCFDLYHDVRPIHAPVSPAAPFNLPNALPATTESRAPPA